jgi:hypothetical protein
MKFNFTYTDKYSPSMIENHYLATVSFHHYWFKTLEDIENFSNSKYWDSRMTIAYPIKSQVLV